MENHKSLVALWIAVFFLAMGIFAATPQPAAAAEKCNIITIFPQKEVRPTDITISKGDCLIWINWSKSEDITVAFKDGAKCVKAVKMPPAVFRMDEARSCFLSQNVGYGQTVSLLFLQPGTYEYDIEFSIGDRVIKAGGKTSGTVTVKE